MHVTEISDSGALERLRPEWTALWQRSAEVGPFQHPDWLLAWWRHVGAGELFVLTVRDDADLVAVAPFFIYSDPARSLRQLTLLGNGISDRCDILLDPNSPGAASALLAGLRARRSYWNCHDFRDLPPGSVLLTMQSEFGSPLAEDVPSVVVDLADSFAGKDGAASAKLLADLRRCQKRAKELGPIHIKFAEEADVPDALEGLFGLHGSRWRARGQCGVLGGPAIEAFHRELADRFARRGWLRLYCLFLQDRMVAANYGFSLRRRAYSYIGGFDPAFAKLSPGRIVLFESIRHAAGEGAVEFDLLRGREDYKRRLGGRTRPQYRLSSTVSVQRNVGQQSCGFKC
jgi:CelD/BcsL family acetyltransferase involved in cellulose biosynthesis